MWRNLRLIALQFFVAAVMVALWQWLSQTGRINPFLMGTPSVIAHRLASWAQSGSMLDDVAATMAILAVGYGVGLATGTALGALLGLSPTTRAVLEPFVVFLNGMPRLLLYPLLVVTLGFGFASKVVLVVLSVVVLTAVTISTGFRDIPQDLLANMRLMGAGTWDLVRQVYLPGLTVWILGTSRTTVGYAFSAAILSEFVGASRGIGYEVVAGQAGLDIDAILAALAVVVAVAVVVFAAIGFIERRAMRWLPDHQN
jgi:NitT/TauT family transport system permease protein